MAVSRMIGLPNEREKEVHQIETLRDTMHSPRVSVYCSCVANLQMQPQDLISVMVGSQQTCPWLQSLLRPIIACHDITNYFNLKHLRTYTSSVTTLLFCSKFKEFRRSYSLAPCQRFYMKEKFSMRYQFRRSCLETSLPNLHRETKRTIESFLHYLGTTAAVYSPFLLYE